MVQEGAALVLRPARPGEQQVIGPERHNLLQRDLAAEAAAESSPGVAQTNRLHQRGRERVLAGDPAPPLQGQDRASGSGRDRPRPCDRRVDRPDRRLGAVRMADELSDIPDLPVRFVERAGRIVFDDPDSARPDEVARRAPGEATRENDVGPRGQHLLGRPGHRGQASRLRGDRRLRRIAGVARHTQDLPGICQRHEELVRAGVDGDERWPGRRGRVGRPEKADRGRDQGRQRGPMEHGGDLADAMATGGGEPSDWLDLSTGINPHPWPVPAELRTEGWTRLPSRADLAALGDAARRAYRVPDRLAIVAAPGTQALIQWLPRLAEPGPVAILGPTYAEHGRAWCVAGCSVAEVDRPDSLARNSDLPQATVADGARHLVAVNPNNPDGRVLPPRELLDAARGRNGWTVIDESFCDVMPDASVIPHLADEAAVVLRSFGKFYGLAGLRLGFAIGPEPIVAALARALGPWAVSGPALAIGRAALADAGWADAMRTRLAAEAATLDGVLTRTGLRIVGGTSLFRLAEAKDARALHEQLVQARIWVRRFADRPRLLRFGLPPDRAGLDRLAAALGRPA